MALLLDEPEAEKIATILGSDEDFVISAGTLAEALIVAARRGLSEEMSQLLEGLVVEVEPLNAAVAEAYSTCGRAASSRIEFRDCFAYANARNSSSRLLYVGEDSAQTDLRSAL